MADSLTKAMDSLGVAPEDRESIRLISATEAARSAGWGEEADILQSLIRLDVQELRAAALALLEQEEEDNLGSHAAPSSETPYRDWFHGHEWSFTACMRLRVALGMEIPEDVRRIVPALLQELWEEESDG